MPVRELVRCLEPAPPPDVLAAAERLRYRDFLTVGLIVAREDLFPDNWIYIHSDEVRVGRIQNYGNWSPAMVPEPGHTSLGLEYFVNEGDELWSMSDAELIALGGAECERLGLVSAGEVVDGTVIRMRKAYPVYDASYGEAMATIRRWLAGIPNLQPIGRNGQHRYNNQDHSMLSGVYAARNVVGGSYDVWDVNVEPEYHEEVRSGGDRFVPRRSPTRRPRNGSSRPSAATTRSHSASPSARCSASACSSPPPCCCCSAASRSDRTSRCSAATSPASR